MSDATHDPNLSSEYISLLQNMQHERLANAYVMFGRGTEFEAIAWIRESSSEYYEGVFMFKDERFSPLIKHRNQYKEYHHQYRSSTIANNVIDAWIAVEATYELMVDVFKGLMTR